MHDSVSKRAAMARAFQDIAGSVPQALRVAGVPLLRADQVVFDAMLAGWRAQMLARGLTTATIEGRYGLVRRFQAFTNEFPWSWMPADVDEFLAEQRSGPKPISATTVRSYGSALAMFCSFVTDARYGWADLCDEIFGDVPSQVCFEWNTAKHATDDAASPGRRAFTKIELQRLFDHVDDFVDDQYRRGGSKRWLPALRDSIAFKVAYAYGLRRREVVKLEISDFGPNPHVPDYRGFGAVYVRWAKGTKGSGPRRRTVLTVPEFSWVVDQLEYWLSPAGRGQFATADRTDALWPSERGALSVSALGRAFHAFREAAGLPEELGLHALRHSYVTHLIEAGYDPLFVQQQVGHSYSSTTALYTSVSSDYKAKVVQRMIKQRIRNPPREDDQHD